MKNIFKDAKFGDKYLLENLQEALFISIVNEKVAIIQKGKLSIDFYNKDGIPISTGDSKVIGKAEDLEYTEYKDGLYASKECPEMLFDCPEDAKEMDRTILLALLDDNFKEEWNNACEKACYKYGGIISAMKDDNFQFCFEGPISDKLIMACEKMVSGIGISYNDCYNPVFRRLMKNESRDKN